MIKQWQYPLENITRNNSRSGYIAIAGVFVVMALCGIYIFKMKKREQDKNEQSTLLSYGGSK